MLIDVLCERHPEADAAFQAWAEDETTLADGEGGAVQAITAAARKAAKAA